MHLFTSKGPLCLSTIIFIEIPQNTVHVRTHVHVHCTNVHVRVPAYMYMYIHVYAFYGIEPYHKQSYLHVYVPT